MMVYDRYPQFRVGDIDGNDKSDKNGSVKDSVYEELLKGSRKLPQLLDKTEYLQYTKSKL